MATLAESFLEDLNDLSDDEVVREELEEVEVDEGQGTREQVRVSYEKLSDVAKLASSERYQRVISQVREELARAEGDLPRAWQGDEDPTYKLLVECNALAVDIENEVAAVHGFLKDKYRSKFPELESLIHHPLDYARTVKAIGNEEDLTKLNLEPVLSHSMIMVVTVTATTTVGKPLDAQQLQVVMEAADHILQLEADKEAILKLVEARMNLMAPNLSVLLGSTVAAKLMGVAGGLVPLSKIPACNVQVLGQKRKVIIGMSSKQTEPHQGFVYDCEVVQKTPKSWRMKAAKLIAMKCTLLARTDAYGQDPTGETGRQMRAAVLAKIEKWQEPPPAKIVKPLPRPDADARKRRGGKRYRKMKERYGLTEIQKLANRVKFNEAEDEILDGDELVGVGMLGKDGSGRIRAMAAEKRVKVTKAIQRKVEKTPAFKAGAGAKSGIATSLAFTPVQGIELVNPNARTTDAQDGTKSYFADSRGFASSIVPGRRSGVPGAGKS